MKGINDRLQATKSLPARPRQVGPLQFENTVQELQLRKGRISELITSNLTAGTVVLPVNPGTVGLAYIGQVSIQTQGGSALLVLNVGGTNFTFTPSGTL